MSLREWWRRHFGDYAKMERKALPDGTRVRLACQPNCGYSDHRGIWVTSWNPRRQNDIDAPDDYLLVREGDGERTYAKRDATEPVGG
jgi:hypothetical protein